MKRWWGFLIGVLLVGGIVVGVRSEFVSPVGEVLPEKILAKYAFAKLRERDYSGSEIKLERTLEEEKAFTSYLFSFRSDGKKVTGQANVPSKQGPFPVVMLLRGYVDKEVYETGVGTRKVAKTLAENGWLTLAPDFLGYGESDPESTDMLEARFEKVVTVMDLMAAVNYWPLAISNKLFLWGHSNGGQIALSVLAITGQPIPTSLWAPVSKPFPYNILYFSDELPDGGKLLRRAVAGFESNYDADEYSLANYYDWIKAPVQIQQGTADESVPQAWSDALVKELKPLLPQVNYYVYPGADHNLSSVWNTAVARDVAFFKQHLK